MTVRSLDHSGRGTRSKLIHKIATRWGKEIQRSGDMSWTETSGTESQEGDIQARKMENGKAQVSASRQKLPFCQGPKVKDTLITVPE